MLPEDRDRLAKIEADVGFIKTQVNVLFKGIEGNGTPGLKQRMTAMEVAHATCQNDMRDERARKPSNVSNWIQFSMLLLAIVSIWLTR